MKSGTVTNAQLAAHERHQARLAERQAYAGYLTVQDAAKLVSVTPNAIEQAIHRGRLNATKISYPPPWGSWRIDLADLRRTYPDLDRLAPGRPRKTTRHELTQDELRSLEHDDTLIQPGTTDWLDSKRKMTER